jgi:uncharacterized membrane protein
MEKKFTFWDVFAIIIALLPLAYLAYEYDKMPAIVPVHFGADGQPNRYGSKNELFFTGGLLAGVSILLYLLMKYLPSIDPKKQVKYGEKRFQQLGMGLTIFMAALNICIVISAISKGFHTDKLIISVTGLLFIFLGNMMYNIKPNYFAGVRTPWTLENEDNWRATHRLAGKVWVAGGIIITVERLALPSATGTYIFLGCVAVMALVPIIYSYIYFKKHQQKNNL